MNIKDRLEYASKAKPVTMPKSAKAYAAVKLMTDKKIGSLVVVNKSGEIDGIVTERDIMTRLVYNKMDPTKTKLEEIMTPEVRVAKADDNLIDWLRIMSNERFRHLPIVDDDQKVIGMMSQGDFVSYTWPELLNQVKQTAKASIGAGYQIFLIVTALLIYAFMVSLI